MSNMIDLIYHVAFATTLIGTRLISAGNLGGWWLRAASDVLFLIGGILTGYSSFIFWTGIILYMDTSAAIRSRLSNKKD